MLFPERSTKKFNFVLKRKVPLDFKGTFFVSKSLDKRWDFFTIYTFRFFFSSSNLVSVFHGVMAGYYIVQRPDHLSVMLNLFQHLIGLWRGALSSKDPESSSG